MSRSVGGREADGGGMDPWEFEVDGVAGCFCWVDCGEFDGSLGPIAPGKFEEFKQIAVDMAALFGQPLHETWLAWVALPQLGAGVCRSARLVAPLSAASSWRDCELWIDAMRERSELEGRVPPVGKAPGRRRL